jgi:phospholipase A1
MMRRALIASFLFVASLGSGAVAQPTVRLVVSGVDYVPSAQAAHVEVVVLNGGPVALAPPDRIPATMSSNAWQESVTLVRGPTQGEAVNVAPGGFLRLRYTVRIPENVPSGASVIISTAEDVNGGFAFRIPGGDTLAASDPSLPARENAASPARPVIPVVSAKPERGNAFLGNISTYQPIYAVYGPGTDADARLQISFKYQLFGDPGAVGISHPWENGIHFAFTQRMFWDLGAKSSPFRSIDFMPEVFYLLPATKVGERVALGGQVGLRHESNGRDGLNSRSLNTLYVQPVASMPIAGYTLTVGPRLWLYTGSLSDNPDIKRYRGNTGLLVEIGKDDGFRLTATSRLNFGTGKGAVDAELSYPLDRLVETGLNVYLFGQAFAGYGENLLDYDRRTNRVRVGIAFIR